MNVSGIRQRYRERQNTANLLHEPLRQWQRPELVVPVKPTERRARLQPVRLRRQRRRQRKLTAEFQSQRRPRRS